MREIPLRLSSRRGDRPLHNGTMHARSLGPLIFAVMACSKADPPAAVVPPAPSAASTVGPSALPGQMGADAGRPFGAFCTDDAECSGGVCFHKRVKGPDAGRERRDSGEAVEREGYCSLRCNDDADCPVPPTRGKCGARGMCKRPE
jgi:hypothetical protein